MHGQPIEGFHPYLPWMKSLTKDKIETVYFPIVDLSIPEAESLNHVLEELETRIRNGERVYIHCWGGRGRAGLVSCCLLSKAYK